MNRIKKLTLILAFAFCLVFAFAGFGVTVTSKAKAADLTADATIEIEDGISLKLSSDGGMRFIVKMNESAHAYLAENESSKLVALIAPERVFESIGTAYADAKAVAINIEATKGYYQEGEYYFANFCVVNIKEANRKYDYTAYAYIVNGSGDAILSTAKNDNSVNSFYAIANKAFLYSDGETDYSEEMASLGSYNWLGGADYPIAIDSVEDYNNLIGKINSGRVVENVEINATLDLTGAAQPDEGKQLPQNTVKVATLPETNVNLDIGTDGAPCGVIDISGYYHGFGSEATITIDGVEYSAPVTDKNVSLANVPASTVYGEKTLTVAIDDVRLTIPSVVVTKMISTAEEFKALNTYISAMNMDGYYMLANDITVGQFDNEIGASPFKGTIDGNGHIVKGLYIATNNIGFMCDLYGTIKNIAFEDIKLSIYGRVFRKNGKGKLENVYFGFAADSVANEGGIIGQWGGDGVVFNNVVFDFGKVTADNSKMSLFRYDNYLFEGSSNVVIITKSVNKACSEGLQTWADLGMYAYYVDTRTANGVAVPATADWNSEIWTVNENSIPLFKGITAPSLVASFDLFVDVVIAGDTAEFKAGENCISEIESDIEGLTFENGVVTVPEGAAIGSKFTVIAKNVYNMNNQVTKEVEVIAKAIEYTIEDRQTIDLGSSLVDGTIVASEKVILNVGSVFAPEEGTAATVVVNQTSYNATFGANGELGITGLTTDMFGEFDAVVTVGNVTINVPLLIVTKMISTKDEFLALNAYAAAMNMGGYYMLGNDISVSELDAKTDQIGGSGSPFVGVIDGNGHKVTIWNFYDTTYANGSWIYEFRGVIKNISFEFKSVAKFARFIFRGIGGTIENAYITLKSIAYGDGAVMFGNSCGKMNIKNVVVDMTAITSASGYAIFGKGTAETNATFTNVVVKTNSAFADKIGLEKTDGVDAGIYVYYADTDSANGVDFPADGWNENYWTVEDGNVTWKNA